MPAQTSVTGVPPIPAMTTDAERDLYYRLAKKNAANGAIVELGAWLGASTAYIAAGIRDSGAGAKAQVFDRFLSKPGHAAKVRAFYDNHGGEGRDMPVGSCFERFKENLGPLLEFVEPHQAEIAGVRWQDGPIAVMITDAPKRVPQISSVLTNFRSGLQPGTLMAWQDFCHFPSYEIPACLFRLRDRLEFVEAVVPGTTLAFRITSSWEPEEVSRDALALRSWDRAEIDRAWDYWLDGRVPPEKAALFACGAAMFLCDIGKANRGVSVLAQVFCNHADAIVKKWRYLHEHRVAFRDRYQPLFDYLAAQGALTC